MTSLRVALVAPRFAPHRGGVETHVERLAVHLAASGHRVEVLTQDTATAVASLGRRQERPEGYSVRRWAVPAPSVWDVPAPGLLRAVARAGSTADVVHAHSYDQLPALAAALSRGAPLVFTPHYHGTGRTPLRAALHRPYRPFGALLLRRARRVIAVSAAEARLLADHFGPAVCHKTGVIPNGVEVPARAEPYDLAGRTILSVGRLASYKRVDLLVRSLAHLPSDVGLTIVGDGPHGLALQQLAADLGLSDRVRFTGQVDDATLARWWASATAFATASEQEAFGITCATALAAGLPTVASAVPAHRELAAGQGPGARVVTEQTATAYAVALRAALTVGRLPPSRPASWEQVAAAVSDVYAEAGAAR